MAYIENLAWLQQAIIESKFNNDTQTDLQNRFSTHCFTEHQIGMEYTDVEFPQYCDKCGTQQHQISKLNEIVTEVDVSC